MAQRGNGRAFVVGVGMTKFEKPGRSARQQGVDVLPRVLGEKILIILRWQKKQGRKH